jgi:hypothetical protein
MTIPRLLVLDNFYPDPKSIANMAVLESGGCGGVYSERSKPMSELNRQFHFDFSNHICSVFNIDPNRVNVFSILSKQTYNPQADEFGMIHVDGRNSVTGEVSKFSDYRLLIGGTIFLSESYDRDSGINFYDDISDNTDEDKINFAINSLYKVKSEYMNGKITLDEYNNICSTYNSRFKLSSSVANVYNRMVAWKCGNPHQSVMTKQQGAKLTHNFYISIV